MCMIRALIISRRLMRMLFVLVLLFLAFSHQALVWLTFPLLVHKCVPVLWRLTVRRSPSAYWFACWLVWALMSVTRRSCCVQEGQ